MSASTETMAQRVFRAIGRSEMVEDPRFCSNSARVEHRALVDEPVGAWFAIRSRDEALRLMRAARVTVGPVYTIADAMADKHFRERGIIVDAEDRDLGRVAMHNILPRLAQTPGAWRGPAPRLGEHTDAVLAEAGLDPEAIARMRQEGAAA